MSLVERIYPRNRVTLREVGLRDGLQLVNRYPDTEAKKDWMRRERDAGIMHFEVGSFLPAARVPQFADIRDLIVAGRDLGVHTAALALNERGAVDATGTAVGEIVNVVSATEEHSLANTRRSREDAVALVRRTVELAVEGPNHPLVQVGIAMAFGCSLSGDVDEDEVIRLAEACGDAGVDLIGLADTVGFAGPDQVGRLCERLIDNLDLPVVIHLHDTRGLGLANAAAALDAGVRILDGSLGGLGGCPFAPGATGNVVIEDLVYLCERKGFDTGIDLDQLIAVRDVPMREMPDEGLYGALAKAGSPSLQWRAQR